MSSCICAMPWFPNLWDQKLLTLHKSSFSCWGNAYLMQCISWIVWQDILYELLPQWDTYINHVARTTIGKTPKLFIMRMRQSVCFYCFRHPWWPMSHLWMIATNLKAVVARGKNKFQWCSVDDNFRNDPASMLVVFFLLMEANISFIDTRNQLQVRFVKIHDKISLTVHGCSFSWWSCEWDVRGSGSKCGQYLIYGYLQSVAS